MVGSAKENKIIKLQIKDGAHIQNRAYKNKIFTRKISIKKTSAFIHDHPADALFFGFLPKLFAKADFCE